MQKVHRNLSMLLFLTPGEMQALPCSGSEEHHLTVPTSLNR